MAKLILDTIANGGPSGIATLNSNLDKIEEAIENTISRDGTLPNSMSGDLDMNNNDIINVDKINVNVFELNGSPVTVDTNLETLAPNSVGTTQIVDESVTLAKIAPEVTRSNIYIVNTLNDLKTISSNDYQVIYLKEAGREGIFKWDSSNLSSWVTKDPKQGIYVAPTAASTGASGAWVRDTNNSRRFNVKWFGAVGDGVTDDLASIQAAMDLNIGTDYYNSYTTTIYVPPTANSYAVSGPIRFKSSNIHLVGESGNGFAGSDGIKSYIKFIGAGVDAAPVILADKSVNNSSQNYQGCAIKNLIVDGNSKALFGFKANGWTRYCRVENVTFIRCVCGIKVDDGFYSVWSDVEVQINQTTPPSGMLQATFDANKYAAYFHICHAMDVNSLKIFTFSGTNGNNFDAAVYLSECDGARFGVLTIEGCNYVRTAFDVSPGCNVTVDSTYIEADSFTERCFRVNDNSQASFSNIYINAVVAPILFNIGEEVGVVINAVSAFNIDCSTGIFKAIGSANNLRNTTLSGPTVFQVGNQSGLLVDAGTTTFSKQGCPSDGILYLFDGDDYLKTGYGATLGATYIDVQAGTAIVNGHGVGWSRASGTRQRLYPDLTYNGSWVVKISGCGAPYIEKASAAKIGSVYSMSLYTFSTPGGGGAPTGLTPV